MNQLTKDQSLKKKGLIRVEMHHLETNHQSSWNRKLRNLIAVLLVIRRERIGEKTVGEKTVTEIVGVIEMMIEGVTITERIKEDLEMTEEIQEVTDEILFVRIAEIWVVIVGIQHEKVEILCVMVENHHVAHETPRVMVMIHNEITAECHREIIVNH